MYMEWKQHRIVVHTFVTTCMSWQLITISCIELQMVCTLTFSQVTILNGFVHTLQFSAGHYVGYRVEQQLPTVLCLLKNNIVKRGNRVT